MLLLFAVGCRQPRRISNTLFWMTSKLPVLQCEWTSAFDVMDSRPLEVVADGLTEFRGAQLATHWCLLSDEMARHVQVLRQEQALHWQQPGETKRGHTPSSVEKGAKPAWSSWQHRSEADGLLRLRNSSSPGQRKGGVSVAVERLVCCLAVRRRLLPARRPAVRLLGAATTCHLRLID